MLETISIWQQTSITKRSLLNFEWLSLHFDWWGYSDEWSCSGAWNFQSRSTTIL